MKDCSRLISLTRRNVIFSVLESWRCISNLQGEVLKILSAEETPQPHQKGDLGGVSNGGWSNACPDELHEDDGARYWIYLSHDYYGHGGIDETKGTQEYANHPEYEWQLLGLGSSHSHLGEVPIRRETTSIRQTYEKVPELNQFPTLSSEIGKSGFDIQVIVMFVFRRTVYQPHNVLNNWI